MAKKDSSLTDLELSFMRYCLGLDRSGQPRRNRCSVRVDDAAGNELWRGLVNKQLAWLADTSESINIYSLTRRGRAVLAFRGTADNDYDALQRRRG